MAIDTYFCKKKLMQVSYQDIFYPRVIYWTVYTLIIDDIQYRHKPRG